jgi:hypothetical protein
VTVSRNVNVIGHGTELGTRHSTLDTRHSAFGTHIRLETRLDSPLLIILSFVFTSTRLRLVRYDPPHEHVGAMLSSFDMEHLVHTTWFDK